MKKSMHISTAAGLLLAAPTVAQSATATLTAASNSVAPGSSITVSLVVDFTTGGAGAGVFGPAGLFGFGGEIEATGPAAPDTAASSVTTAATLPVGATGQALGNGSSIAAAAAGRSLAAGGLAGSPQTVLTLSVDIDPSASSGDTVTIDYNGAVVLSLNNSLVTFSTDPGANQQSLTVAPLVLSIGAGRLCADSNTNGAVEPGDFGAWVAAYNANDPVADVNQNMAVEPGDFGAWVAAFNLGAAGPTCSP